MKTSTVILPGIKFIGWVDSRLLQKRVDLAALCSMPVAVMTTIHEIIFCDEPECECTTEKEGGAYKETTTLKFLSDAAIPESKYLSFVVTDVNGKSFLIGSREHPLPTVERSRRAGIPAGDSAGWSYEIKHTAIKSLIPCII